MSGLADLQIFTAASWSAAALLIYDITITLEAEAELVWKSDWGFPKCLFLLSRYFGLAFALANALVTTLGTAASFCNVFNSVFSVLLVISSGVGDALLLMRILAVYHQRVYLRRSLIVLTALIYLAELALACLGIVFETGEPTDVPDPGCLLGTPTPEIVMVSTVPILALNLIFFILTVVKLFPKWRHQADQLTPLTAVIVRDGTLYFGMVCTVLALSTAFPFIFASQPDLSSMGFVWIIVISPIASCRTFLNLRAIGRPNWRETTIRASDLDRPIFNVVSSGSDIIDITRGSIPLDSVYSLQPIDSGERGASVD